MRLLLTTFMALACATAHAGDTIYKYRDADGRIRYSDQPVPGTTPIGTFEYTPPAAVDLPVPGRSPEEAAGEIRINRKLAQMDAAWREVQASARALDDAQARRAAGTEPREGEVQGLVVDGVHRARFRREYLARLERLDEEVEAARLRNQRAWARYNQLR